MRYRPCLALATLASCGIVRGQDTSSGFNGLHMNLGNLSRLSDARSRSISPENFTGEKGKAGMATEGHRRSGPLATWAATGRSRHRCGSRPAAPSPWPRSTAPARSSRSG